MFTAPQTIEDAASQIWGMARDLASPSVSGTSLNSERQVKLLIGIITAYAKQFSEPNAIAHEASKAQELRDEVKHLKATIRELKEQLKTT